MLVSYSATVLKRTRKFASRVYQFRKTNRIPVKMVKNTRSRSVLRKTQDSWAKKLGHIGLNKLNRVRTLADGSTAYVFLVQLDGQPDSAFALKTMQKAQIKSQPARRRVMSEKKILSSIRSDFVIRLYKTLKDKKHLYFLTEYCPGGDMSNRGPLPEVAAKFYIGCITEALDCLHSENVSHNDLKPENLALDDAGYLKVIDFGQAEEVTPGELSHTISGTTAFVAPEVLLSWSMVNNGQASLGRDRSVDLWALGVLFYEFLKGKSPFEDKHGDQKETFKNIIKGIDSVRFPKRYFSPAAVDLIRKLCAADPTKRLGYGGIEEIRKHRWFANFNWDALRMRKLKAPAVLPNFDSDIEVMADSEIEEDESDWDMEF